MENFKQKRLIDYFAKLRLWLDRFESTLLACINLIENLWISLVFFCQNRSPSILLRKRSNIWRKYFYVKSIIVFRFVNSFFLINYEIFLSSGADNRRFHLMRNENDQNWTESEFESEMQNSTKQSSGLFVPSNATSALTKRSK